MMASNNTNPTLTHHRQMDQKQTFEHVHVSKNESGPSTRNESHQLNLRFENIIRLYHDEGAIKNRRPRVSLQPSRPKLAARDNPHIPILQLSPPKQASSPSVEIPIPSELASLPLPPLGEEIQIPSEPLPPSPATPASLGEEIYILPKTGPK